MRRCAPILIAVSACGRVGFESQPDADATMVADCAKHEDALFCDGFEDPGLSGWQLRGGVGRADTGPRRGTAALQADTQFSQDVAEAKVESFGTITSGALYTRGWFYVPSGFDFIHADFIDLVSPGFGGIAVLGYGNDLDLFQNSDGTSRIEGVPLPRDRWLCIELAVQVGDPGGVGVTLDGVIVAETSGIDMLPGPGFGRFAVGLPWTDDGQLAARVFVDDIVIDTKPIGCD